MYWSVFDVQWRKWKTQSCPFICFWIYIKILIFRKVTAENCLWHFFHNSIFKNIFLKNNFWKFKNFDFSKNYFLIEKHFIEIFDDFFFDQKMIFRKIKIFDFSKLFFENRVMKKMSQKVFGSNFSKNKYFYINQKAYEQAWPWLSFPLLDITNGPVRKKVIPIFR